MDEIVIEDGKEIKKSMPYLKLSMYLKPELFTDVVSNVGAMMDLYKPEEYVDGETEYAIPKALVEGLKTVTTMLLDLLKDCEKKSDSASSFNNLEEVKK